jgi:energy-coupling factor transporter ATP-binding protein EcfA2
MRKFQIDCCPFDDNDVLYTSDEIEIHSGLTVLVGCNGSGKSTLLQLMNEQLNDVEDAAVLKYDNLTEGGTNAKDSAGWHDNLELLTTLLTSSEGEQIVINLGQTARAIKQFVHKHAKDCKELWILIDALDSGLSIDNIVAIKEHLFKPILEDIKNQDCVPYIVVSANSYELCCGFDCLDVGSGKYIQFNSYEEYKDFIMRSSKIKESRYKS